MNNNKPQSPLRLARVQIITVRISKGILYHPSHLTLYFNSSQNEPLVTLVSVSFYFVLPSLQFFVVPLIAKMMWAVWYPDPTQLTQGEGSGVTSPNPWASGSIEAS